MTLLFDELVVALAEEAADAFEANHPGEFERDELTSEATLAALRWVENCGCAPDAAHALRLMKSHLYDVHRRRKARPA